MATFAGIKSNLLYSPASKSMIKTLTRRGLEAGCDLVEIFDFLLGLDKVLGTGKLGTCSNQAFCFSKSFVADGSVHQGLSSQQRPALGLKSLKSVDQKRNRFLCLNIIIQNS